MPCRCAERRQAIARGVMAIRHANFKTVKTETNFVASSSLQDLLRLARRKEERKRRAV